MIYLAILMSSISFLNLNAVEFGGGESAGSPFHRPAMISMGRGAGDDLVKINGCSTASAFQLVDASPGVSRHFRTPAKKRPAQPSSAGSCQREGLDMNKALFDFANRHMENCIREGWNAHIASRPELAGRFEAGTPIRIHHEGCKGDPNHKPGSWHSRHLAWDISAIEIGGTALWYMNGENVAFFTAFRQCWGAAVSEYHPTCSKSPGFSRARASKPAGTVGKEDENHQNHLHVSLPCMHLLGRNARKMYRAGLWTIFLCESVWAEEEEDPRPKVTKQVVGLKDGKKAELTITETEEPVGRPMKIGIAIQCGDKQIPAEVELHGCAFESAKFEKGKLVIKYKSMVSKAGGPTCRKSESFDLADPGKLCP